MDKYLAMSPDMSSALIGSDLNDLGSATRTLMKDMIHLSRKTGFGYVFLQGSATFSAMFLLILERTNWRTNMLKSLLILYVYLSLPSQLVWFFSGQFGKWIAFLAVLLRIFFPDHFPERLEMPGSLILLLLVAPNFFAHAFQDTIIGLIICLVIGCYLLQEHFRASGGFRSSFAEIKDASYNVGIVLFLALPVLCLIFYLF